MQQGKRSMTSLRRVTMALLAAGALGAGCFLSPDPYPGVSAASGGAGGAAEPCSTPGESGACYTGPAGTEGKGVCHGGTRSCGGDGLWGACAGDVVPAVEDCATAMVDEDCDGKMSSGDGDGDCACEPGSVAACYTGPSGTVGVGACHSGSWTCNADGLGYGPCEGQVLPAMEEVCGDGVLDETCDSVTCPGDVVWAIAAGGTGAQHAYDVAVDSDGNVLVAGSFQGDFTIGATTLTSNGTDSFVLKLDPGGAPLWVKQLRGIGSQLVRSIAVDNIGNVYFTGYFDENLTIDAVTLETAEANKDIDIFVGKLAPLGILSWIRKFGTGAGSNQDDDQHSYGIAVIGEDDIVITGSLNGTVDFTPPDIITDDVDVGAAGFDLFVARLGPGGAAQWFKAFGASGALQVGRKIAFGSAIHVVGHGAGSFGVGPDLIDSGVGTDVLASSFAPSDGTPNLDVRFGTVADNDARGLDIALDPFENVLLTGYYDGEINFGDGPLMSTGQSRFVSKRSSDGQHLWSMGFPAATSLASADVGAGIAADTAGNVLITGHFLGTTDLGGDTLTAEDTDIYVAKLAPAGAHRWSRSFGNALDQYGVAIAADPTDHAVVVGNFVGQIDFGSTTVTANNSGANSTLFVAKLAP